MQDHNISLLWMVEIVQVHRDDNHDDVFRDDVGAYCCCADYYYHACDCALAAYHAWAYLTGRKKTIKKKKRTEMS